MRDDRTMFLFIFSDGIPSCPAIFPSKKPYELVAQIHPRMPAILPKKHHAAWFGETDDGNLKGLLVPILTPVNVALLAEIPLAACLVVGFPSGLESHDVSCRYSIGSFAQDRPPRLP
ncbi:MAG: hypothetical protein JO313_02025 [Verrucomicrobia bacterium]|nr:hypothetical protein [Verrucomicrobiota bacterium]